MQRFTQIVVMLTAGAVAACICAAPSAADNSEYCFGLNTLATKCQKQGNVEINDSLSHANVLGTWATNGLATGGPYYGTSGGGNR